MTRSLVSPVWPSKNKQLTPAGQGTNRELFARLDADLFLGHQLFRHGCSGQMFTGVTNAAERCERIRREILASGLDDAMVLPGSSACLKTPETLAQAFERLYGEPLIPTKSKDDTNAQPR